MTMSVVIALSSACWWAGCGGGINLTSQHRNKSIIVDGESSDWEGIPPTVVKDHIAVSVCNDEEYLYLCLSTGEREIEREMLSGGFSVWFDPGGGSKKIFGFHFPLSVRPGSFSGSGQPGQDLSPEEPPIGERVTKEMEILGPGEQDRSIVPLLSERQVQVALGNSTGRLVYELRVPLPRDASHLYGIGLPPGGTAGIGLVTAEVERGARMQRSRGPEEPPGGEDPPTGDGMVGGRPGGGRRHGGGMGGMQGGRGSHSPLDIWMKVVTH